MYIKKFHPDFITSTLWKVHESTQKLINARVDLESFLFSCEIRFMESF